MDKSLLQQTEQEGEEPRLLMLETIREYGLECLRERAQAEASQRAHALYYLALAEEAEPQLKGAQQVPWWRRLEREQENLRAALSWLIGQEEGELASAPERSTVVVLGYPGLLERGMELAGSSAGAATGARTNGEASQSAPWGRNACQWFGASYRSLIV